MSRRSTLRPADKPADTLSPEPAAPGVPSEPHRRWSPYYLGGALLVAGLVAVALVTSRGSAAPPAPSVEAQPTQPATNLSPCPSVGSWLEVLAADERQGHMGQAWSSAQTALRTPGLCEQDRAALAQKAVDLGREALFEQPPAPEDAPGQRRVVAQYVDLKALALQYGAPPPPPLQVARSANDNRLFLLATVAYADAFATGDSSALDRDVVRADYAAQYNLGLTWSRRPDQAQRQEGLARLATACRIDEREQLGSLEACTALTAQLGPRAKWPTPLPDPLIDPPTGADSQNDR